MTLFGASNSLKFKSRCPRQAQLRAGFWFADWLAAAVFRHLMASHLGDA
jgi:hypothetical protein